MRTSSLLVFAVVAWSVAGIAAAVPPEPVLPWSLLPQPAEMHPAAGGAVSVSDGDRVRVQAGGDAQALAIVRGFAALVADTRGLDLRVETGADESSPAAIVFHLDPQAQVVGDAGYRIAIGDGRIEVTARDPRGLF